MTAIQPFDFNGHQVRVITDEHGEPWFVGTDVARVLGYVNPSDVLARLDDDERMTATLALSEGSREVTRERTLINESGAYALTFSSTLAAAKDFRRWVTREVLPAIRKTGAYGAPALSGPELLARAVLEADATIKQLAPKAEAFDAFLSTSGDYSVNEAAKILSRDHAILTGEDRLRNWLAANGWIYKDHSGYWSPYQNRIDQGRLAVRVGTPWYHPTTGEKQPGRPQVRVTAKGIDALVKALTKVTDQGELTIEGDAA